MSPAEAAKLKIREWDRQIEGCKKQWQDGKQTKEWYLGKVKEYKTKIKAVQEVFRLAGGYQ